MLFKAESNNNGVDQLTGRVDESENTQPEVEHEGTKVLHTFTIIRRSDIDSTERLLRALRALPAHQVERIYPELHRLIDWLSINEGSPEFVINSDRCTPQKSKRGKRWYAVLVGTRTGIFGSW